MSKTDSIRLCNPIPELVEEGGLLVIQGELDKQIDEKHLKYQA